MLSAAREAFAKHGYERASLDDIAAAASVTKGSIYHHYGNKHGLFRAVFEDIERQMVQHIEQVAIGAATYFEAVRLGCEAFLEVVLRKGVARIVLADAPSVLGWTTWRAIDSEIGGRSLRTGLEAAMRTREILPLDVDALTTLISGALNEAALTIAASKSRKRAHRAAVVTLRRILDGLRSDSPARRENR